jgi:quercetin dioxygenase-like cupin family protein
VDKEKPMITEGLQPVVNTTDEPPVYFLGLPTIVRATRQTTNGGFGLIEHLMLPPGFASPYHTHRLEDEAFYLLEGEMAFVCDGRWTVAGPGTYVFGPRNIPHGFKVVGNAPARMLLLCSPGGFEQFLVELSEPTPTPPDMAKLVAAAAKYQVDIHGPLPS